MADATLRIIDANLNRAREALRVIEDHARFGLDDADVGSAVKHLRHDLMSLVSAFGASALLRARDIVGDAGRETKANRELQRETPLEVVRAAFGRLSEALRSIGEYAKLRPLVAPGAPASLAEFAPACASSLTPTSAPPPSSLSIPRDPAALAEQLRYRAYEIEQRLVLRGDPRRRFRDCRLYVIITAALCRDDWLQTAAEAIRGGATCLQLREKSLPDGELLRRARRLRELTTRHGVLLFVNDRPDIATLCHADGVHVGQGDLSVRDVRRIGGGGLLVGVSSHTPVEFEAALAQAPDYIAVGPIFPSRTKPRPDIPGLPYLESCRAKTELPLVAIGGIDAAGARAIRERGVPIICVCSAVIAADNPQTAARALL